MGMDVILVARREGVAPAPVDAGGDVKRPPPPSDQVKATPVQYGIEPRNPTGEGIPPEVIDKLKAYGLVLWADRVTVGS